MRNWTWLVLVASGGLAWACGGDDDGNGDGGTGGTSTTGSGGSGGTGGSGGSGGTGGSGGSGGSGGGTSTGNNTTGTGGGNTTATGSGGSTTTTGTGGSAGADAGGAAGDAGAAGADTGSGGTGGGDPPTIEEACAAACANQADLGCADPGCDYNCVYASGIFAGCEEEYLAQQVCVGDLEPSDLACVDGYPATALCPDEDTAFNDCVNAQ